MQTMTDELRAALKTDLAMIDQLLALPSVQKHESRFEDEIALVAPTSSLSDVCGVVEQRLPPAVKPSDQDLPAELEASGLLDAMGGIEKGQTLYLKPMGDGFSLYVAFWPWGNGQRFTIKIGVLLATPASDP